jgi:adenylosuccinate synthase
LKDPVLSTIAKLGSEFGTTTGRARKVNWLNLDDLVRAINISGTTHLVISKCDVLESLDIYRLFWNNNLVSFSTIREMKSEISTVVKDNCPMVSEIFFSHSPEAI